MRRAVAGGGSSDAGPAGRLARSTQPVGALDQLACDRRQAGTRVAQRQPRPAREVAVARAGRGRRGSGAPARRARRHGRPAAGLRPQPVAHEHERVSGADHRAAHAQAPQRRGHQQVHERLALRANARRGDVVAQLLARQRALLGERVLDRLRRRARRPPAGTPSCARRRMQPVTSGGVVSACSHG